MTTSKLVEAAWLSYREAVLPRNAPAIQLQECRRAFYAGARGLMTEIMRALTPGPDAQEPDTELMMGIERELAAFARKVESGLA